ncbi:MAG TPA: HAMP domain-containing sensor histidine kinase [Xanthobacteraceae bacterium]|nr:HAMP domain-containing sensor histidine kinase [Xanthobacteraceae bacterium]
MTLPASEDRGASAADKASLDRRRAAAKRVREARDRLTSTSGTRPAFDYELLRQFAQNRLSASIAILLLIATIGFLSGLWTGPLAAGVWTVAVLAIHVATLAQCRRLLAEAPAGVKISAWRARFVALDLAFGIAWALNVTTIVEQDSGSGTFMLFVMLLVVAVSSMLASTLPIAMFAATVPVTTAVAFELALRGDVHDYILAAMAVTAQGYFTMLAHRLYSTTLATLEARAEKDALIGELEQAKAKSDEARRHAEAANIAKSRFLAQMSHELRTPLNAILGFSEVMKSEVFGPHAVPTYKEYAADIHNSGQHLLNLINEILDLSRIEAGHYELNEEAVQLADIVEDCHRLLKLRARTRGLVIHEVFEPELPRLWADERAVRQIVLNLLSNAIKFTPQGGEVWLKVGWTASGGQYMTVKDTGPGIPEEEIPVVLALFGQGSNAIKSAEQGTGLGLPIAKSLVDLHGGTFTLKSKLREGTEVIVTFPPERVMAALGPLAEPTPALQPSSPSAPARGEPPAGDRITKAGT